jgi:hypothetical protein
MGNEQASQRRYVPEYRYPSGNLYSGEMVGNKRSGQGRLVWIDGAKYEGNWENDQCEGAGRLQFPNGSVYEGRFVKNNPYGEGKLTTVNGEALDGFWEYHGRSQQTSASVGKYQFKGDLIDLKTGQRRRYQGPLALYLQSGLVSLPNMADPMEAMFPYAVVLMDGEQDKGESVATAQLAEEGRALFQEGLSVGDVPIAYAVQTAPSTSSSISYGQADAALGNRHPEDHATFSLLDPRLYLSSLGFNTQPVNINEQRQNQIRGQQQPGFNGTAVPFAAPAQAYAQTSSQPQGVPSAPTKSSQPVVFM